MSEILKPILPIEQTPGMPEAIATVVAESRGTVCVTCGLERMGHGPESEWLGFDAHRYDPVPADAEMLAHAEKLTHRAYSLRPVKCWTCGDTNHTTAEHSSPLDAVPYEHTGFECGAL